MRGGREGGREEGRGGRKGGREGGRESRPPYLPHSPRSPLSVWPPHAVGWYSVRRHCSSAADSSSATPLGSPETASHNRRSLSVSLPCLPSLGRRPSLFGGGCSPALFCAALMHSSFLMRQFCSIPGSFFCCLAVDSLSRAPVDPQVA